MAASWRREWIAQRQKILLNETNSEWRPIISPPIAKYEESRKRPRMKAVAPLYSALCDQQFEARKIVSKIHLPLPLSPCRGCKCENSSSRSLSPAYSRVKGDVSEKSRLETPVRECVPERYIERRSSMVRESYILNVTFTLFLYMSLSDIYECAAFIKENLKVAYENKKFQIYDSVK